MFVENTEKDNIYNLANIDQVGYHFDIDSKEWIIYATKYASVDDIVISLGKFDTKEEMLKHYNNIKTMLNVYSLSNNEKKA